MKGRSIWLLAMGILVPISAMAQETAPANSMEPIRPKLSAIPKVVKETHPDIPEEALKAGHHGTVYLRGTLGMDGILKDVIVKQSSGSSILDNLALSAIRNWTFTPALDVDGKPVAIPINVPMDFYSSKSLNGGLAKYKCQQFVRDSDWHDSTFGKDTRNKDQFYLLMAGLDFAGSMRGASSKAVMDRSKTFSDRWEEVISRCRQKPDDLFMKIFGSVS